MSDDKFRVWQNVHCAFPFRAGGTAIRATAVAAHSIRGGDDIWPRGVEFIDGNVAGEESSGTAFAVHAGYLKISGGEPLHDPAAPRPNSSRLFSILSSDRRQSAGRV